MVNRVTGSSEDAEIDRKTRRTVKFLFVMVVLLFLSSILLALSKNEAPFGVHQRPSLPDSSGQVYLSVLWDG